ncbi:MAG: pyridoxamine 5'-phosphate oxidase family protein [Bacteroidales bacterium]
MQIDKNQVLDLIRFSKYCNMSTINEYGYPRIIMMAVIRFDDLENIWFATSKNSEKYKQLVFNNHAGLIFQQGTNYASLIGEVDIFDDQQTKNDLWSPALEKYFPLGMTDDNYIILKFRTKSITAGFNYSSYSEQISEFVPGK